MIAVSIETLIVGIPPSPSVVVLRPKEEREKHSKHGHVLPIWIGPAEAASIGVALEGQTHARPMTHDLMASIINALKADITRVVIDRNEGTTFFATVYLRHDEQEFNIDARPSDSIALAVRTKAPLFVDEDVLNQASYPYEKAEHSNGEVAMEEFRSFLDSITPEDFETAQ